MTTPRFRRAMLLLILLAAPAWAQKPRPQQPKRERMPRSGVIKGVLPGVLAIETEDGGKWLVSVANTMAREVSVIGVAEPAWVQPSMLVRFRSRFTRRREAVEPIRELEVVTPREGLRFGVFPETTGGLGGVGGVAGGLFDDAPAQPQFKPRVKPVRPEEISYEVVGKVTKIRKGEMTIAAGGLILKAELAENARVGVNVSDLRLARAGDKVELNAWYLPDWRGQAVAESLSISLGNPIVVAAPPRTAVAAKPAGDDPFGAGGDEPAGGGKEPAEAKQDGDKKPSKENPFDDDL